MPSNSSSRDVDPKSESIRKLYEQALHMATYRDGEKSLNRIRRVLSPQCLLRVFIRTQRYLNAIKGFQLNTIQNTLNCILNIANVLL